MDILERVYKFVNGPGSIIIAFTSLAMILYSLATYLTARHKFNEWTLLIGVILYLISFGIVFCPVGGSERSKRTIAIFIFATVAMSIFALLFTVLCFFILSWVGV